MKRPLIKAIWVLIVLILVLISIPTKQKNNDNEVVFWTLQMNDFAPYMNKVIKEFEVQNPEIKIKWIDVPFSEGEKRTLASVLSDNPPDLINLNAVVNYNMDEHNYFTLNMNNILDRHNVITNGSFEYWDLPYNWTISYNHTF